MHKQTKKTIFNTVGHSLFACCKPDDDEKLEKLLSDYVILPSQFTESVESSINLLNHAAREENDFAIKKFINCYFLLCNRA